MAPSSSAADKPPREITRELAAFATHARFAALPENVRAEAPRAFLNWMGCVLGGCRDPAVEIAEFMPEIREAIGEDFQHRHLNMFGRIALASTLRKRGYETAYIVQSSFKAALVPFAIS